MMAMPEPTNFIKVISGKSEHHYGPEPLLPMASADDTPKPDCIVVGRHIIEWDPLANRMMIVGDRFDRRMEWAWMRATWGMRAVRIRSRG